jgi:hypothetical protein
LSVPVTIELLAKADKALDSVMKFTKTAEKEMSKVSSAVSFLKGALVAAAGSFVVTKIVDGLKSIVDEAAQSEQGMNRLRGAMRAAGDFSEQNVEAFSDFADQLARVSKYDDDVIIGQLAVAKSFNTSNKEATRLVEAAANLAGTGLVDFDTATQLLGRSLDGTAGKLRELIPETRGLTAAQLANGAAIDLIAKKYKGFAESELNTFSGALAKVGISYGDVGKALGKSITENESVITVLRAVSVFFTDFKDLLESNKGAFQVLVTDGVVLAAKSFEFLVKVIKYTDLAFVHAAESASQFINRVLIIPRLASALKESGLKGLTDQLLEFSKSELGINKQTALDAFEGRKGMYDRIGDAVGSLTEKLEAVRDKQDKFKDAIDNTKKSFDGQRTSSNRVNSELLTQYQALTKSLETFGDTQVEIVNKRFAAERRLIEQVAGATAEGQSNLFKLQRKKDKELLDARRADIAKELGELQKIAQNPIAFALNIKDTDFNKLGLARTMQDAITAGVSGLTNILQGKQGAVKLLSGAAEALGQAFIGVPGVGGLFEALAQGPEKVRAMVREFAQAVPDIIQAVLESVPVVIEEIANRAPEIIDRLVERAPDIIARLVERAPDITLAILKGMVNIATLGAGKFIAKLIEGAPLFISQMLAGAEGFVGKILEGAGQFIEKIVNGIGDALNKLNPAGGNFMGLGGGGGSGIGSGPGGIAGTIATGGLSDVGHAIHLWKGSTDGSDTGSAAGGSIVVPVNVNGREIANVFVDLKRYGYRLEPA